MSNELVPNPRHLMGDADRELVIGRLNTAVSEGRLTFSEFEDRVSAVLAARTFGEVEPHLADLPGAGAALSIPNSTATSTEPLTLAVRRSALRRDGRWVVPNAVRIESTSSSVRLNFTEAVMPHVVRVEIEVRASSLRLIVPPGSTVDTSGLTLQSSSMRTPKLDAVPVPGQPGTHFVITGELRSSSMRATTPFRWFWQRRR